MLMVTAVARLAGEIVPSGIVKEPPGLAGSGTTVEGGTKMLATLMDGGRPEGNTGAKEVGETRVAAGVGVPLKLCWYASSRRRPVVPAFKVPLP